MAYIPTEEEKEIRKQFGENLSKARNKKLLTQEELAEKLPIDKQSVSNWENGYYFPKKTEQLMKIADILDCDLDYLTGRIEECTHDIHSIHEYTGLSEKAIKRISSSKATVNGVPVTSPMVNTLNHLIESDGFQDFVNAYMTFLAAVERLKTATIPETVPYPVNEEGAYVIDGSTSQPEGAQTVIGRDTVTLRTDEYARWCMNEAADALKRICERDYQESNEMCKKNSRQKKRTEINKNRRHE